jgi:hypothetical protein
LAIGSVRIADGGEAKLDIFLVIERVEGVGVLAAAELGKEIEDVKTFSKRSSRAEVPKPEFIEFDENLLREIEALYELGNGPKELEKMGEPPVVELRHPRERRRRIERPSFAVVDVDALEWFAGAGGAEDEEGGETEGDAEDGQGPPPDGGEEEEADE